MGETTGIQWTGSTWTPIRARHRVTGKVGWHCTKPSAGCKFCYSESLNKRLGTGEGYTPNAPVDVFLDEKMLRAPLRWRAPRKIFVCSMTDLFGEFVTDTMIDRVFAVMAASPQHTYQVLTKRAERMRTYLCNHEVGARWAFSGDRKPLVCAGTAVEWTRHGLPNVWIGCSVENQQMADNRIPVLLNTPAAVRFLSVEPLLAPMNVDYRINGRRVDWIIVGGESGAGARRCDLEWIGFIVDQCKAAKVACFVKQLGKNAYAMDKRWPITDSKGGNIDDFPDDLKVREYPA